LQYSLIRPGLIDGEILFLDQRIDHELAHKIAKMGIIQVLEGRRIFQHLTVEENLKVGYIGHGGEKSAPPDG
jgi:ABC-type branched-subunit amino acid transport system ATPase component